jgi:hypothetical protein
MKKPEPELLFDFARALDITPQEILARMAKDHADKPEAVREHWQDLAVVMATPAGLRVLWHILRELDLFKKSFTGNSETYYNLGKHEFAQKLFLDMTQADPIGAARLLVGSYMARKPEQGEL